MAASDAAGRHGIAVLIVSYRCAPLTIACLRALEPERRALALPLRAIVVDNASGDLPALEQAVREHGWQSWVELLQAPRNGGFAYGNNLGIAHAYATGRPRYLHLLNPDAQIRPGAVAELLGFLEAHPEVGIAGSGFEDADGSDWPFAFRFPSLLSELNDGLQFGLATRLLSRWVVARRMHGLAQPVDWVSGASMMVRASVFDTIGGLDENFFLYFEETDFCRRARRAAFATWYVPQSRVMHLRGEITRLKDTGRSDPAAPARLPAYWFESRRRYYALAVGPARALIIDAVALFANALGALKRLLLGRRRRGVPYYIRDLARHSLFRPANWALPAPRYFLPRGG
jgi:GT2 family glycosyltransferase